MAQERTAEVTTLSIHRALKQPITGETSYTGVVLPKEPPIDKVLAACLLVHRNSVPLETIEFWNDNKAPPEKFLEWRNAGIYPIDLDDFKYHDAGVRSASEFVAAHLNLAEITPQGVVHNLTPGFAKLVEMINKNNKTGYLRGMKYSIPYIIREAYQLKDDDAFHAEIVSKTIDVLESYAAVENGTIARSVEDLEETLPELVELLKNSFDSPLTLGRYLRDRYVLGDELEEIRIKIGYWLKHFETIKQKLEDGDALLQKLNPKPWSVAGVPGILIKSDDHFLLKAATRSRKWGVRIIVSGRGHTTISTNAMDLSKVDEVLQRLEPGRWYYQKQMGVLINGGVQYTGVEPTGLSAQHLIQMLQGKVQPKKN